MPLWTSLGVAIALASGCGTAAEDRLAGATEKGLVPSMTSFSLNLPLGFSIFSPRALINNRWQTSLTPPPSPVFTRSRSWAC